MGKSNRLVTVGGDKASVALDTDATLAGNSDAAVATQKAVKAYVDAKQTAAAVLNMRVPVLSGVTATGAPLLVAAAVATDFIPSIVANNGFNLVGTAAQNSTKVNNVIYEVVLPDDYVAGTNVTCSIAAGTGVSGGTTITSTVDLVAGLYSDLGLPGADICATAAQAITTDMAEKAFTITGATLTAGCKLALKVTTSVQEAGNTGTAVGYVAGIRLS